MTITKVKELLEQLQTEIKNTNEVIDSETQQQLKQLDSNINDLLARDNLQQQDLYDGIMKMEYGFLNNHPMAANLMRGIVDMLSKTGI
ncbi:MAG TPA: DUF4404 family protein [Oceanospirillales bacterium]|nr:DUF4404 family protein [Oceanospirillales bacterium]